MQTTTVLQAHSMLMWLPFPQQSIQDLHLPPIEEFEKENYCKNESNH